MGVNAASDGERSATSGYRNQYHVGAKLIIEALRQHDLDWVRVADPAAGRVDDIQIARTARIDACQIKWRQYAGTLTLNDLVRKRPPHSCLIAQLSDGWKRLKDIHPHHRVVVRLVTNDVASTRKGILPKVANSPSPYHFAAFVEQAWKPAKETGQIGMGGPWSSVWHTLQIATDLGETSFSDFVNDCELDLHTTGLPDDEDHRDVIDLLFEIAASPQRIVKLSRAELLNRLGWRRRYEYRNLHEFDVPRFYRPITATVDDLSKRLNNLSGGYIGLFGSPGSGKSTLLTRTLRSLPIRLVQYYAYVPEAQDPTVLRGETTNFLHDVTLRLEQAGFGRSKVRSDSADRRELLERLHEQLQALGSDFKKTGTRTVILVDGLDHIAREQRPERSLLSDMPLPSEIPHGVFVVLGTQTSNLAGLPPLVRREIDRPERCVKMERLSPSDVASITAEEIPELSDQARHSLFQLSAGHPLALIYLVNRLRLVDDKKERAAILTEVVPYSDDIEAYYWSHWERVQDDEHLTHVLGLLARVRGSIGMDWARRWIGDTVARKLDRVFGHYFDVDAANRWSFFHNSFRVFLHKQTSQSVLGQPSEDVERELHSELARRYVSADRPWRWEALHHRYRAGDHKGVLELATSDWFQEQARCLRPFDAIETDLRLAFRSAGLIRDPLDLIRLTLIGAAIGQQKMVLENYHQISDRLLDLGEIPQALELIRDGYSLRVGKEHAFSLSGRLAKMGMEREGARLFELAEPYSLLSGSPVPGAEGGGVRSMDLLRAWAKAAPSFRTPDNVIKAIERLVVVPDPKTDWTQEQITATIQTQLGIHSAVACARRAAWSEWETYVHWLEKRRQGGLFETLLWSAQTVQEVDSVRACRLARDLLALYAPTPMEENSLKLINERLDVAELSFFSAGDSEAASAWISDITALPLQSLRTTFEDGVSLHKLRFRLYRLRYYLGEALEPGQLVTRDFKSTVWRDNTEDSEKQDFRVLSLVFTTLAALWGRAKRASGLTPASFIRETEWIIDRLSGSLGESWSVKNEFNSHRLMIVDFLIGSAAQHGRYVVKALEDELARRWSLGEWYLALRRHAITALARAGEDGWARDRLTRLEEEMCGEGGPHVRAEEHWDQANAWLELGDTKKARNELQLMALRSRGLLDDHDYQSEVWVRWMGRANERDPENAEKRMLEMLRRLVAVSGEASGIGDAAKELIAISIRWRPRWTIHLMKAFQEKCVLNHGEAFSCLLRSALSMPDPPLNAVLQGVVSLLIPFSSPRSTAIVESLIASAAINYGEDAAVRIAQYLRERISAVAVSTDRKEWLEQIESGLGRIYTTGRTRKVEDRSQKAENESFDTLIQRAISQGSPNGWDRHYDGGSRIEALQEIQRIEPKQGRIAAIELYSKDLGVLHSYSFHRLLINFDEILPLLFDEVPALQIWELIDDYLQELYASVEIQVLTDIEEKLSKGSKFGENCSAAQAVADAIVVYFDHPSFVVAASAVEVAAAVLQTCPEAESMQHALVSALSGSEVICGRALAALEARAENRQYSIEPFRSSLQQLLASPNLMIRFQAATLMARHDDTLPMLPHLSQEIPAIYTLKLPQLSFYRTEELSPNTEAPVAINDPARALCPLDIEARWVANEAKVDEDAVLFRAARFLEQFTREYSWKVGPGDQVDESQSCRFLERIGLQISFHKPHIEPACRAVAHVAAELWDAHLLDSGSAERVANMFFHHDPSLVLVKPRPRPNWIPTIIGISDDQRIYKSAESWLEPKARDFSHFRSLTPDKRIILGEVTRFAYLGLDERIEEDRYSYIVALPESRLLEDNTSSEYRQPFYRLPYLLAQVYARADAPEERLIIAPDSPHIHTHASNWIAINPLVARGLRLHHNSGKLFQWIDEHGQVSVESFWWTDGCLERHDRHLHCSVGEGWLVLASRSAYERLLESEPCLSRGGLIRRRKGFAAKGGSGAFRTILSLPHL